MKHLDYCRIAPMNIHFVQFPLTYFLDCIASHGLNKLELWGGAPHVSIDVVHAEEVRSIRREIAERGLSVSCFTPETCAYPINIASEERATRERSVEYELKSLRIARDIGAPLMQLVCGTGYFDLPSDEAWKWACDSLRRIAEAAAQFGIGLALEPLSPYESNLVNSVEQTKRMLEEVGASNLGVNVDTVPLDMMNTALEDYFQAFGDRITNFHLCDRDKYNAWIPCGDGDLPMGELLRVIDENEYAGALGLEICGAAYYPDPNAALGRALATLKRLIRAQEAEGML